MKFSYFIICSFLSFGISKSQDLKETVRNILKEDELREDIKKVILHLLKNDEILKRNVIEMVKEDLEKDFKSKFYHLKYLLYSSDTTGISST